MIDQFCQWLAWKLPRRLLYYAVIRAGADASVKHGTMEWFDLNLDQVVTAAREGRD